MELWILVYALTSVKMFLKEISSEERSVVSVTTSFMVINNRTWVTKCCVNAKVSQGRVHVYVKPDILYIYGYTHNIQIPMCVFPVGYYAEIIGLWLCEV